MTQTKLTRSLVVAGVASWVFCAMATAEMVAFEAKTDAGSWRCDVPLVPYQGIEYLPLGRMVEEFGGAVNMLRRRMSVDLNGTRAWVQTDDKRVSVLNSFRLRQPVRRFDDMFFIAHVDVEEFFRKAFRMRITPAAKSLSSETLSSDTWAEGSELAEIETLNNVTALGESRRRSFRRRPAKDRPIEVIVIDPGHGGRDAGVSGPMGAMEKDVTLAVASVFRDALAARVSAEVFLTRSEDLDLTLQQRALIASRHEADLVITLHTGGSVSPLAHGAAIFFPPRKEERRQRASITRASITRGDARPVERFRDVGAQSQDIATALADALEADTGITLRGVYEAPCKLLSRVGVPGILLEVGCLTNPAEELLLQDAEEMTALVERLAVALDIYLGDNTAGILDLVEPGFGADLDTDLGESQD